MWRNDGRGTTVKENDDGAWSSNGDALAKEETKWRYS
jgi:hypothetical protein